MLRLKWLRFTPHAWDAAETQYAAWCSRICES
jgi:hypothetical protein